MQYFKSCLVINLSQQHYQDLFPAKLPLSQEVLAQASLGLLLLERQEQERRAELSSGEDNIRFWEGGEGKEP